MLAGVVAPFSPVDVDLGPIVDVDFVVSSLVRDDLEVLDILDVHFPSSFVSVLCDDPRSASLRAVR